MHEYKKSGCTKIAQKYDELGGGGDLRFATPCVEPIICFQILGSLVHLDGIAARIISRDPSGVLCSFPILWHAENGHMQNLAELIQVGQNARS